MFYSSMKKLGLYLHFPFCEHKCGYCDFNSWENKTHEEEVAWFEAIKKEFEFWKNSLGENFRFDTIFFGGGTPSLMNEAIFKELCFYLKPFMADDCEWTVECNPETLTLQKLKLFSECSVNRLSLGVQSFQDKFLEKLERKATRKKNIEILNLLSQSWPGSFSFDLMYALPQQSLEMWKEDLDIALEYTPKHLSCYQLTLSTARSRNWKQASSDEILVFDQYNDEFLEQKHGLKKYEISNFAVEGYESKHNLKYWNLDPYLALGPGAYAYLSQDFLENTPYNNEEWGVHLRNPNSMKMWSSVYEQKDPWTLMPVEKRSALKHFHEQCIQSLRLRDGMSLKRLPPPLSSGLSLDGVEELFYLENDHLKTTLRGRDILDSACVALWQANEKSLK